MKLEQDGRRTLAQFLNGLAVAVIGIGAITPIVSGHLSWTALVAFALGAGLRLVAVWATRR